MAASPIDVQYVADLARLKLSPEEIARFQQQLGNILNYVSLLEEADLSSVEADLRAVPPQNNLRADVISESFTPQAALANAPRQVNQLIQVPKIVE